MPRGTRVRIRDHFLNYVFLARARALFNFLADCGKIPRHRGTNQNAWNDSSNEQSFCTPYNTLRLCWGVSLTWFVRRHGKKFVILRKATHHHRSFWQSTVCYSNLPFSCACKNAFNCVLSTRKMRKVCDRGQARSVSTATPRGDEPVAVRYGTRRATFLRRKLGNFAFWRAFFRCAGKTQYNPLCKAA